MLVLIHTLSFLLFKCPGKERYLSFVIFVEFKQDTTVKNVQSNIRFARPNEIKCLYSYIIQTSDQSSTRKHIFSSFFLLGSKPKHTIQVKVVPQLPPSVTEKPKYPQVPQEPIYPQVPIVPTDPKQPAQPQEPQYPTKPKSPSQPGQPQLPQDPTSVKPKQPPTKPEPPTSSGSVVIPLIPGRNGVILEHGQAGPPGRRVQIGSVRPQGADGEQEMQMSKGFAGAPGKL